MLQPYVFIVTLYVIEGVFTQQWLADLSSSKLLSVRGS